MSTYSLASYASMLSDPARMPAYLEALRRTVRPGSVVLDLGAGFGYFALVACRLGAAKVYAVEPAKSVKLLPELARLNGFADRIVAICDLSTRVTLPEPVDVVVADIRGVLPTLSGSLRTMIDARDRLMRKGGTLLPFRDRLFLAPLDNRGVWMSLVEPWADAVHPHELTEGLKLEPVQERLRHGWSNYQIVPRSMLAPGKVWAEINYHTNTSKDLEGEAEFAISRPGTLHGWGPWFEAEIMDGLRYSTGPDNVPTVYGSGFFPLPRPLALEAGDRVSVRMSANDVNGQFYLRWRTKHTRDGRQLAAFEQGDFFGQSLDLERLKQRLPTSVPALKPEGQLARMVIEGAHEGRAIGEIARQVQEAFPGRFENHADAIDYAAQLLDRING